MSKKSSLPDCTGITGKNEISLTCKTTYMREHEASVEFNRQVNIAFKHLKSLNSLMQKSMQIATAERKLVEKSSVFDDIQSFLAMFEVLSKDQGVITALNTVKSTKATFKASAEAKDVAYTLSSAFEIAYQSALNEETFAGTKFNSKVEDLIMRAAANEAGDSMIDFKKLFSSIVQSSKNKLYDKEMQGESKVIFRTLAYNDFEKSDQYKDHATDMHKAFSSLCRLEYSKNDLYIADAFCGDEYISSIFNLFDSIGLYE